MSTPVLSSDMTRSELLAVYQDCSDYDLVDSLARARLFIHAARMLLATPVRRTAAGGRGEEIELEIRIVSEQLQRAEGWALTRGANTQLPRQVVPGDEFRG